MKPEYVWNDQYSYYEYEPTSIDPWSITPPHAVVDQLYMEDMVYSLNQGDELPSVYVSKREMEAITGSHRIAAWREAGQLAQVLFLSPEDEELVDEHRCEFTGEIEDYGEVEMLIDPNYF